MGGLFNGGIFGGGRGNAQRAMGGGNGLAQMMMGGNNAAANVPGIHNYQRGLDPAVSAGMNVWGTEPGMDPAQIAASNVWADKPGMFDVGGALYSPYKGHVDRMSHQGGYKTRHMRGGGRAHE